MFIKKISRINDNIKIETPDIIIQFPIYKHDTVNNIINDMKRENFVFFDINFLKYALKVLLKKGRIISISH